MSIERILDSRDSIDVLHDCYFNSFSFCIMSYVDRVHCRDMSTVQIKDASIYLSDFVNFSDDAFV